MREARPGPGAGLSRYLSKAGLVKYTFFWSMRSFARAIASPK